MPRPRKPTHRAGYQTGKHFSPGQGSVVPIKGGTRWRGAFTWHDPETGTSKRIWITGIDEADVLRRWEARKAALEPTSPAARAAETLTDYLARWLEEVVAVRNRPSTLETYTKLCGKLAKEIGYEVRLCDLTAEMVSAAFRRLLTRHTWGAGRAHVGAIVLKRALADAVEAKVLERNPAAAVVLPRLEQRQYHMLDLTELRRLLALADDDPELGLLWMLIGALGLRRGEALGLRWEDIDLAGGVIAVRGQIVEAGGEVRWQETKTRTAARRVRLPSPLLARVRAARLRDPERGLIFRHRGQPWRPRVIDQRWRALLERAGLPIVRLHDLRHGFATEMLVQGEHAKLVQETLGHSTVGITLDTYSHVAPTLHDEAMERRGRLLWPDFDPVVAPDVAPNGDEVRKRA